MEARLNKELATLKKELKRFEGLEKEKIHVPESKQREVRIKIELLEKLKG